jgi:hypothetical protein
LTNRPKKEKGRIFLAPEAVRDEYRLIGSGIGNPGVDIAGRR